MKITRAEDYALTFVAALAEGGKEFVSLREISQRFRLPESFLKKIAHQLKAAGLIKVREGRGGGYRLARDPKTITLEEVMRVFNPQPTLTACVLGRNGSKCPRFAFCDSRKPWQIISHDFYKNLRRITLQQLTKR